MKAFGSRAPASHAAPTGAAAQNPTPAQRPTGYQPQQSPAAPRQPASPTPAPSTPRGFGGGLPPPDPNAPTGGTFERRDKAYWDANPLTTGSYTFNAYVSKIVWWSDNGIGVTLRAVDWLRDENRPGKHHGRDIGWAQTPGNRQGGAYNMWRAELVGAYAAGGWPEESWPKDDAGNPAPPWHNFWVWQTADGLVVPLMLTVGVAVTPPSSRGSGFTNVKSVALLSGDPNFFQPYQAPMPFELPQPIAEFHGWPFGEPRSFMTGSGNGATVVPIAKDAVPLGHCGMLTYKDL